MLFQNKIYEPTLGNRRTNHPQLHREKVLFNHLKL